MYLFRRPTYLRWAVAFLVVVGALYMDLRGTATDLRPFASVAIEAGANVDDAMIEYREAPIGLLPDFSPRGFARVAIEQGEPLTAALLTERPPLPDGWWALEMEVPAGTALGSELRLVVEGESTAIPAIVVSDLPTDQPTGWSADKAMVAIPADSAAAVANAEVSVLVVSW